MGSSLSSTGIKIDGGGGINTLVAPNIVNTWQITDANAGSLDGFLSFQAIQHLVGSPRDTIAFQTGVAGGSSSFTLGVDTNLADAVIAAVNGLPPQSNPITIVMNLEAGNYSDLNASPPAGVTLVINGTGSSPTIVGHSPALTVTSGTVVVNGATFTTATDAPTILVTGGMLVLRNDTIQESTGFTDAAIAVTGGTVDLGTTASPGNNIINLNGTGQFVRTQRPHLCPRWAIHLRAMVHSSLEPCSIFFL